MTGSGSAAATTIADIELAPPNSPTAGQPDRGLPLPNSVASQSGPHSMSRTYGIVLGVVDVE